MTPSIRSATPPDAAGIAAVYAPYVRDGFATFELEPPDAGEFARRMASRPRLPWLIAEDGSLVVGFAYASPHRQRAAYRWSVDVSVYLAAGARGQGTGRALYERLLATVASLGYVSAFAGIALPNEASEGLHRSMGFTLVGIYRDVGFKLGRWRDVGWYQRRLAEPPPADPAEPRDWAG